MIANFNLPEFYLAKEAYQELFRLIKQYPEILLPNTNIHTIFGNFPACIWNGGSTGYIGSISLQEIQDIISFYNEELNIPLRFTFTNPLLQKFHCFDSYSNMIVQAAHNGKNEILVANSLLERYLRNEYPNYKYCRSIITAKDICYLLNSEYGEYSYSVLKRQMNNNWEYLQSIPQADRPKIELLCNDPCPDDCPRLYTHYNDFAYTQLTFGDKDKNCECTMQEVRTEFTIRYRRNNLKTAISRELIDNKYLPLGYCEFKLSGRQTIVIAIQNIIEYLIQPDYKDDVLRLLFRQYLP